MNRLRERIRVISPEFMFSFYYRRMLPPEVLALAKKGAFNMHGSLLPKSRGRAPVNWAILKGESETGATLHEMVAKPDAGRIVDQERVPIGPDEIAAEVFAKVSDAAETVLRRSLPHLLAGTASLKKQDLSKGSYFGARRPEDGRIDWSRSALEIHNLVRAVAPPYPGAFTDRMKIFRTRVENRKAPHGRTGPYREGDEWFAGCGDGRHRHAGHLREAAAAGVRARLRGQPADRARLRAPRQAPRVPLHLRGVRHVARPRLRPGRLAAGVRPDPPAALDLRLLEAADGPRDLGLRPAGRAGFHAVPAVQLDRRRLGLDQHAEGRQLARGDAVLRPHRARRAHPAGRRRQAEARLHLCRGRDRRADGDHRQPRRHRLGEDLQHRQSAQQPVGARARQDDGRPGAQMPRVPRRGAQGKDRAHQRRALLRPRLPGHAEPRAEHRRHQARPRMAPTRRNEGCPALHLRRVPHARRRSAPSGQVKLALKVDVDTFRGTRDGVPRLVKVLKRHGAGATFLFSLGPDHTGRALRRVFKKSFLSKVRRTSVLEHYGIRTLLYGTLLPGPDIGRRCADTMRAARDAGFEVGIHCWDHVRWQDYVARRDAAWTEREMRLACERFEAVFRA